MPLDVFTGPLVGGPLVGDPLVGDPLVGEPAGVLVGVEVAGDDGGGSAAGDGCDVVDWIPLGVAVLAQLVGVGLDVARWDAVVAEVELAEPAAAGWLAVAGGVVPALPLADVCGLVLGLALGLALPVGGVVEGLAGGVVDEVPDWPGSGVAGFGVAGAFGLTEVQDAADVGVCCP